MSNQDASQAPSSPFLLLPSKVYTFLKWLVLIALPAAGTFYNGLALVWGFPVAQQVNSTILLVASLLGILIGVSSVAYNKQGADGVFTVNTADPKKDIFNVKFNQEPLSLAGNKQVRLTVKRIDQA